MMGDHGRRAGRGRQSAGFFQRQIAQHAARAAVDRQQQQQIWREPPHLQGGIAGGERHERAGVHVVGVMREQGEIDRSERLDRNRDRHHPIVRSGRSPVFVPERVGQTGIDENAQPSRPHDKSRLAQPVRRERVAIRDLKPRGERPGEALGDDPGSHLRYAALPASDARREIASKAGPEVGMSIAKTSAIACVHPWMK